MPHVRRRRVQGAGQAGAGLKDIIKGAKKINRFLKKNKVISRVGRVAGDLGLPGAHAVGRVAKTVGYGGTFPSRLGIQGGRRRRVRRRRRIL